MSPAVKPVVARQPWHQAIVADRVELLTIGLAVVDPYLPAMLLQIGHRGLGDAGVDQADDVMCLVHPGAGIVVCVEGSHVRLCAHLRGRGMDQLRYPCRKLLLACAGLIDCLEDEPLRPDPQALEALDDGARPAAHVLIKARIGGQDAQVALGVSGDDRADTEADPESRLRALCQAIFREHVDAGEVDRRSLRLRVVLGERPLRRHGECVDAQRLDALDCVLGNLAHVAYLHRVRQRTQAHRHDTEADLQHARERLLGGGGYLDLPCILARQQVGGIHDTDELVEQAGADGPQPIGTDRGQGIGELLPCLDVPADGRGSVRLQPRRADPAYLPVDIVQLPGLDSRNRCAWRQVRHRQCHGSRLALEAGEGDRELLGLAIWDREFTHRAEWVAQEGDAAQAGRCGIQGLRLGGQLPCLRCRQRGEGPQSLCHGVHLPAHLADPLDKPGGDLRAEALR